MFKTEERVLNVWITIRRSAQIPDQWVAHCLDVDVVTQGDTARHAFKMIEEAAGIVIADDLARNQDPSRRRAAEDDWAELRSLCLRAKKLPLTALDENPAGTFVINMPLRFIKQTLEIKLPTASPAPWGAQFETPIEVQGIEAVAA